MRETIKEVLESVVHVPNSPTYIILSLGQIYLFKLVSLFEITWFTIGIKMKLL